MELRKSMKKKRPPFRRVESWRWNRVKDSWRAARGIDSKTRKKSKAGITSPEIGYRVPKKIRGLHPSGYQEVRVETLKDIENLNNKKHAIKIATTLGAKKRMTLIEYARRRGFKVLNIGTTQAEMQKLQALSGTSIED